MFDDMLARSVPLYAEVQRLITDIAERFSPDGAVIYDLGCSTGTTLLALSRRLAGKAVQFAGVELSQPMIEKARANLSENGVAHPVLVPYRVSENVELLQRSGFGEVDMFFRWLNFAGFVAVKT